jgi:hypothetical protein
MSFTIELLSMTNNNKHQIHKPVFSRQSYLSNEQNLPTSGLAAAAPRTSSHHPARQTRFNPLDAENRISRVSAGNLRVEDPSQTTTVNTGTF